MGNGSFNRHKARPIHNPCHPQRHQTQMDSPQSRSSSSRLKRTLDSSMAAQQIPVRTDGKGQQCRMMLVQIPCFQRLGLAFLVHMLRAATCPRRNTKHSYNLETLLSKVCTGTRLLSWPETNAEVGVRSPETRTALGPMAHAPNRNIRGLQLCQFCNEHRLAVANTWTPQRNKTTWWHPRFGTAHLIDFFTTTHAHIGNVHRVLTLHPEVAWTAHIEDWTSYTDHNPVEMTIKLAPPKGFHRPRTLPPRPATYKARGIPPRNADHNTNRHSSRRSKTNKTTPRIRLGMTLQPY